MKNFIDQLVEKPIQWLSHKGPESSIAISSRIRFARNIKGFKFPAGMETEERRDLFGLVGHTLRKRLPVFGDCHSDFMSEMDMISRQVLLERHLISTDLLTARAGCGLAVSRDEVFSVMVNEEDHLRMQGIKPGLQLYEVLNHMVQMDQSLNECLGFSYRDDLGYLTACPTNLGTGMRASVMLHLPGLVFSGQIQQVINAMAKMGLAVRGIFGEGSDALCNLFQISNQSTLGEDEHQIIGRLIKVVDQVINHEKNARQILLESNENFIYDRIGRAYGVLKHAYVLGSREALSKLSALRLGVDLGAFASLTVPRVNELIVVTQPGHLQKYARRTLDRKERDVFRAMLMRNKLSGYEAGNV